MLVSCLGIIFQYVTLSKSWVFFKSHYPCKAVVVLQRQRGGAGQRSRRESGAAAAGEIYGQAVTRVNVDTLTVHHFFRCLVQTYGLEGLTTSFRNTDLGELLILLKPVIHHNTGRIYQATVK